LNKEFNLNGFSAKASFLLTSHACKQILSCVEERVKISEDGETFKVWSDHKNKPFNAEFILTLFS